VPAVLVTTRLLFAKLLSLSLQSAFPRALERLILYGLSPVAAELLTTRFEELDKADLPDTPAGGDDSLWVESPSVFFQRFYSVFEDRNAAMAALLDGKEAFAAQVRSTLVLSADLEKET
jgi:hypothetical protein